MPLLEPGVPTAMFGKLDAQFVLRGRIALSGVADAIKRQAKINASNGSHTLGTPTPARPGLGPAIISKTLVNSLDRSPITRQVFGWYCRIGTAEGRYPPYGGANKKPSSRYGRILELEGCKNGATYPFLYSAARFGFDIAAPILYREAYGANWVRLI